MPYFRWRNIPDIGALHRDLNRVFDTLAEVREKASEYSGTWVPAVDVKESPDAIVIYAELPGMTKDDVKISIKDNTLILSGEKKRPQEDDKDSYHRMEREFGPFSRTFALPAGIDTSKTEAVFKDGVLVIKLAKAEAEKAQEIHIRTE